MSDEVPADDWLSIVHDPDEFRIPERHPEAALADWLDDLRAHRDSLSYRIDTLERLQLENTAHVTSTSAAELQEIYDQLAQLTNWEIDSAHSALSCPLIEFVDT